MRKVKIHSVFTGGEGSSKSNGVLSGNVQKMYVTFYTEN